MIWKNLSLEWNKIIPLPFFSQVNNIFSFFSSRKKQAYLPLYAFEKTRVSCYKLCEENKSIKLQTLREKQKYEVTNVGVKKIKLSLLPVQHINEFKMYEIQRKTPQWSLKPSWQTVIVSYFWALIELASYIQAADDSKRTGSPA